MSDDVTTEHTTQTYVLLLGVRAALVIALAVSVAFPDWEQFDGKGMAFRAPFYLLPTIVVPIVWRLRGSHRPYPYLVDALVVAPFLVDTLGNVFNFYNNYDRTDDVLHFLNWVLLMAGVTLGFARTGIGRLERLDPQLGPWRPGHHLVGSGGVPRPGDGDCRPRT